MAGFDESSPLKESFRKVWDNSFQFTSENEDYFQYAEQFTNSPFNDLVDGTQSTEIFQPFVSALESGAKQKIIKKVDFDILAAFALHPITILSNVRASKDINMTRKNITVAFEMAWDAIRLNKD